ncbi:DUF3298 and DUF4163 domain-containing protein [Paenibacillus aquistagni]|uniref:DUF3298 and DUF4163 domain-containing protein n=1 Tax=Paenibacillus aquistagni TaxID=1852522 RepID=UPI000A1C921D|nr:DUF3298 and DUF4163 domain-containing protein [Paenibacillus aquistagni]
MELALHPAPVHVYSKVIRKPKLEVFVPQVEQAGAREATERMNRTLHHHAVELIKKTGYGEGDQTEVTGTYEVKLNERGLLSILLIVYGYTLGAAHGMTYQEGLTFDTNTGNLITLKDLFKPGASYVDELSEQVAKQIKERDLPVLEPFTKIKPDQPFYLTDKALVLFFDLYELLPYVYGFPYFPISIYDLESIKKENGPIDTLWY